MEHKFCRENLSAYLDGELRPEEKARLEAHLAGCPDCRAELGQLRAVSGLVKAQAMEPVPPALKKAVLNGPAPARPWLKPALAFSAAAAGLLVVFNLTKPGEEIKMERGFAARMAPEAGLPAPETDAEQAAPAEAPAAPASSLYAARAAKTEYPAPAVAAARGSYAQAKFAAPRAAGSFGAAAGSGEAAVPEFRGRVAVQVSLPGQASAGMHASLAFLRGTGIPLAAATPGRLVFIKDDGSRATLTGADCAYGFVLFDGRQDPLAVTDLNALPAAYAKYFGAAPGR